MYILVEQHVHILFAIVAGPYASPSQEETLVGGETIYHAVVAGVVQSLQCHVQTAVVADILAQRLLAVHFLAVHHLDGREIVGQECGALVEGSLVGLCPPVALVAGEVKLAPLVVEAVAHLVANHSAYRAVVLCIVGFHVEEWGLQYACGEAYLVGCGIVVCIDCLGVHVPLLLVHGLVHLAVEDVQPVPLAHVHQVLKEHQVLVYLHLAVVLPLVGVSYLDVEVSQFLFCLGLGSLAHPVESLYALAQSRLQVAHHCQHALLACFGEIPLAVHLADGIAQHAVDQVGGLFPQVVVLRLSCERLHKGEV